MAARLARFKVAEDVVFVPAIQQNPMGKILRGLLEEEVCGGGPPRCGGEVDGGVGGLACRYVMRGCAGGPQERDGLDGR
jgi:hypothetical protein